MPDQVLAARQEKVAALAPLGLVLVMDAEGNELVAQNADEPFSQDRDRFGWRWRFWAGTTASRPTSTWTTTPRAVRARGRRSLPDFGRAGSARASAGIRGSQWAQETM